jgi:hypothetical protein
MTIELTGDQTIYSIDYLSVYCYAVGVDFGHINVDINPAQTPVPPKMPPVRDTPPTSTIEAWKRSIINSNANGNRLRFSIGDSGGAKARAMRSICETLDAVWYVNGVLTPEVWVQRGVAYDIEVLGGQENALYITSEETGGWTQKPPSEKDLITNYIGGPTSRGGECRWQRSSNPDLFDSFDAWATNGGVNERCAAGAQPAKLHWTPDARTPATVFYGSYDAFNMGGPIRVCDRIVGDQCL